MKSQYEMIEAKLNAAHAVISEVQSLLKLMHENGLVSFKDEKEEAKDPPRAETEAPSQAATSRVEVKMTQGDFFDSLREKVEKPVEPPREVVRGEERAACPVVPPPRRRGAPAVDRKSALRNYRDIVRGREIVNLSDVNRIFGYNSSTSGTFVRDAVRHGSLKTIEYGRLGRKFLAKDVMSFIRAYFDVL